MTNIYIHKGGGGPVTLVPEVVWLRILLAAKENIPDYQDNEHEWINALAELPSE